MPIKKRFPRKFSKENIKEYNKKKLISESKQIAELQSKYESIEETKIKKFTDFPLSQFTQKALAEHEFYEPTDIQKQSIGLALKGNDILGAAKTGSGKTLAFLIPILERLYCIQWTRLDGLGALVISPTRELAYQIYETLRKVGKYHDFSAGLIIGGKDLNFEKKRLDQCNIIIGTPGRILQHMDENPYFNFYTMKILVLDEADRCLDMGFQTTMNAIIGNLPLERQTLLFSATQTKSVKDLARLSLKDPIYVSVHEHAKHVTPEKLQQSYLICKLEDKISVLWSFIKHHSKQKIIVFFSSCKQVKYIYESFCRMRPGLSLLALYGTLHQLRRMEIYEIFCKKQSAVLFATDVASRGLDFPGVHWVVQMDCPEDTNAYIHRAGRTARFQHGGESLLVLLPSEEKIIDQLIERKIPINKITVNPNKLNSPQRKLEALLARDVNLKESAQRAFVAYVKSVFLMKDKEIFDIHALDTDSFSKSLGLAIPPRIRFLRKLQKNIEKKGDISSKRDNNEYNDNDVNEIESGNESSQLNKKESNISFNTEKTNDKRKCNDDMDRKIMESKLKRSENNFEDSEIFANLSESDEDENFLTVKRTNIKVEDDYSEDSIHNKESLEERVNLKSKKIVTKAAMAKKILRKKIVSNKKTSFDEEGKELVDPTKSKLSELGKQYENEDMPGINIEIAKEILREEDKFDKQRFRDNIKKKHKLEKQKLKNMKKAKRNDREENHDDDRNDTTLNESGSGSEDFSTPDLSWLPDPDKIYGSKKDDSSGNQDSDIGDSSSSEYDKKCHRPQKGKLLTKEDFKRKNKRQQIKISENLNLSSAEEIAMRLLKH